MAVSYHRGRVSLARAPGPPVVVGTVIVGGGTITGTVAQAYRGLKRSVKNFGNSTPNLSVSPRSSTQWELPATGVSKLCESILGIVQFYISRSLGVLAIPVALKSLESTLSTSVISR